MAEVRMVPGPRGVFVVPTVDGEVKIIPGKVFFTEAAAAAAGTIIPQIMHHRRMLGVS